MSERALREELELLGAELARAKEQLARAQATREARGREDAARHESLLNERGALQRRREPLQEALALQGDERAQLHEALSRARARVPPSERSLPEFERPPKFFATLFGPTPPYAKERSWPGRVFARVLTAIVGEWK